MNATRRWLAGVAMVGAACALALPGAGFSQEKKAHEKHDASSLDLSLRDVINTGAKMFNAHGDHAGCYRVYQGALLSVRPFLAPELQKKIDQGLIGAEMKISYADRAFALRHVLDEIRDSLKPAGTTSVKPTPYVDLHCAVAGKVSYNGKPIAGGYFVTLVDGEGKKFSSAIQKNGSFQFKTPIPAGEYRVAVEPIPGEKLTGAPLPARYTSETTSGLTLRVQAGKQQVDLNLVN